MVTVGGILPSVDATGTAGEVVSGPQWHCRPPKPIVAPHLTIREAVVLQSQLPSREPLSREDIQNLGFDLAEDQIEAFQTYYRQYPTFAEIVS